MRSILPAVFAVAALLGSVMVAGPTITMALVVALWMLAITWRKPLVSAYLWWIAVAVVPTWIGFGVANSQFVFGSALALVLVPGVMAASGTRVKINALDWAMFALVALMVFAFLTGGSRGLAADSVFQWALPYVLLRLISLRAAPEALARMILGVGLACAAWAIIEFVFGLHVFETLQLPGSLPNLQAVWQSIQMRAGVARSEASFGTSIALSGFLAIAIPYSLQLRLPWLLLSLAVLGGGMVCTFARTGALAAAVIVGLTLILRAQRYRIPLALAFISAVIAVGPVITGQNVDSATANDFASSNGYRDYVFSTAVPQSAWFGPANLQFGAYVSVDNAYLRVALESGLVPALALLAVFGIALLQYLRHRQGPALAASIAMGMSLYVVALITQWQMFIFAVLGIASTEIQRAREERTDTPQIRREIVRPHSTRQILAPRKTNS